MPLTPIDDVHARQIQAGILGRKTGHKFEDTVAQAINSFSYPFVIPPIIRGHIFEGDPAELLLSYLGNRLGLSQVEKASAISTGALATSEEGKQLLSINGSSVSRCKSDLVVTLHAREIDQTIGVSTKQSNNKKPTNAQLYFTTARGFSSLLTNNDIPISRTAVNALRQFCGDAGFRPTDNRAALSRRLIDPRRFFWEEIDSAGREEWERVLHTRQDDVSRLLFQKAYLNDPFIPDFLLHKTKFASSWRKTEVALFTVEELVLLSRSYQGFATKPYSVRKGSYKDPPGVRHDAPRFGVIQMQRGGQAQHPEQLQFNLGAGYFYKL